MPTSPFRKRQRFTDIPGYALSKGIIPTFHVGRLSSLFPDAPVGLHRKDRRIRLPEITETGTLTKRQWNPMPQASTGTWTPIANHKGNDMPRTTQPNRPEPLFIGSGAHKTPGFINFQHILRLDTRERLAQRRQGLEFFFIQAARVLRDTPKIRRMPRILGRS